ncbi:hypothetical protein U1Q18_038731, partial [Sarracenia purpurea var. burkii]
KHGSKFAAREKAEADGGDGEERIVVPGQIEVERGERKLSKETDGEDVRRTDIGSHVVLPHDGSDLFRGSRKEASWICE